MGPRLDRYSVRIIYRIQSISKNVKIYFALLCVPHTCSVRYVGTRVHYVHGDVARWCVVAQYHIHDNDIDDDDDADDDKITIFKFFLFYYLCT